MYKDYESFGSLRNIVNRSSGGSRRLGNSGASGELMYFLEVWEIMEIIGLAIEEIVPGRSSRRQRISLEV